MSKNLWLDGVMGLVVGDALGVPVQFFKREEIRSRECGPVIGMEAGGVYKMPEGTWSDDSSMALASLAGILERKEANPLDIMLRFANWLLKGEYTPFGEPFDQGNSCLKAILAFAKNLDVTTCGVTGEHANGNGALMRILPVCLYYYERQTKGLISEKEALEGIQSICALTHNHLRSHMCCGLYYFMVKQVADSLAEPKQEKRELIDLLQEAIDHGLKYYGRESACRTEMVHLARLFYLKEFRDLPEEQIKTTGYVVDTIEAAIWCLITTTSFQECLLKVVNLGEDADTVAAVAGGLAGLYYGYEAIPKEWLDVIKKREWIEGLCEGLVSHDDVKAVVADVHSHMLPGIDDGASDMEETRQMIRLAYAEGCRHLFLTPHAICLEDEHAKAAEKMEQLREWIRDEKMELQIYPGAEIFADSDLGEDAPTVLRKVKDGTYPTLNGTEYVLIEFSLGEFYMDEVRPVVQGLIKNGYIPVIAHAERYGMCKESLRELKEMGCLLQMNICDLYYKQENDTNRMTHLLLKEKMIDLVGTDAHGIRRRSPKMKEYIDFLYRNYERDYVDAILYENAVKIFGLQNQNRSD